MSGGALRARGALCSRRRARGTALFVHADLGIPRAWAGAAPAPIPELPMQPLTAVEGSFLVAVETTRQALTGLALGSLAGLGSGLWNKRGFNTTLQDMRSSGLSFGFVSAVYAGVSTAARLIRGKEDRYNSTIASCASGGAFYAKGGPRAMVQGCVTFAAFSYFIDMFFTPKEQKMLDDTRTPEEILRKTS